MSHRTKSTSSFVRHFMMKNLRMLMLPVRQLYRAVRIIKRVVRIIIFFIEFPTIIRLNNYAINTTMCHVQ